MQGFAGGQTQPALQGALGSKKHGVVELEAGGTGLIPLCQSDTDGVPLMDGRGVTLQHFSARAGLRIKGAAKACQEPMLTTRGR